MPVDPASASGEPRAAFMPPAELTARALGSGALVGVVLAVGNIYMGLKTGWWDSGNIFAAILGYAFFSANRARPYTVLENNVTQAAAAAVAAMPSTIGLLGAVPALALAGHTYSTWALSAWGLALGVIGVIIALPLRRRLIVDEALPFPSGIATAEVIAAAHAAGSAAIRRARALLASGVCAGLVRWFQRGRPAWIPEVLDLPGRIAGVPAASFGMGFGLSPLLLGAGALIGPAIALSVLAGALLAWGVLAPALLRHGLVAVTAGNLEPVQLWLNWPGVALTVAAALLELLRQAGTLRRALGDLRAIGRSQANSGGDNDAPLRQVMVLGGLAVAATLLLGWWIFRLHPLITLLSLAISVLLANVCARASGQTDIAPLGPLGQLTQAMLGMVERGNLVTNIAGGSVVAGDAAQTGTMLYAFKTGQILGGSPRRLIYTQLFGMVIGALVSVPAYQLVTGAFGLHSGALPAPTAIQWKTVAEVVSRGREALPAGTLLASAIAFAVGVALTLWRQRLGARGRFLPSSLALGIGFILGVNMAVTVALGALVMVLARKLRPTQTEAYAPSLAAGAIAGESLVGVLIALLIFFGILPRN